MLGWLTLLAGGTALMGGAIKEGSERRNQAAKSNQIHQYVERWTDPELEERLKKEIADPKNEEAIWARIKEYQESKGYWTRVWPSAWDFDFEEFRKKRPLFSVWKYYPDGKTQLERKNIAAYRSNVGFLLMQTYGKLPMHAARDHAIFDVYPINKK